MVENLKNLLRNQEADDLKTWYTASGLGVLPMFSYGDSGLTLTIFMTGSNLFPNASALVLMQFQFCSYSAYPQYSGE